MKQQPITEFTPMTEGVAMLTQIVNGWIRKSVAEQETQNK